MAGAGSGAGGTEKFGGGAQGAETLCLFVTVAPDQEVVWRQLDEAIIGFTTEASTLETRASPHASPATHRPRSHRVLDPATTPPAHPAPASFGGGSAAGSEWLRGGSCNAGVSDTDSPGSQWQEADGERDVRDGDVGGGGPGVSGLYVLVAGRYEGLSRSIDYDAWPALVRPSGCRESTEGEEDCGGGRAADLSKGSMYVRTVLMRDLLLDSSPMLDALTGRGQGGEQGQVAGDASMTSEDISAPGAEAAVATQLPAGRAGRQAFALGGGLGEALARACALGTMSSAKLDYTWDPIHNALAAAAAAAACDRSVAGVGGEGRMPCRVSNVSAVDALRVAEDSPLLARAFRQGEGGARQSVGGTDGGRRGIQLGRVVCKLCDVEAAGA